MEAAVERDYHQEITLVEALTAFEVDDGTLAPLLNAWVTYKPSSFAPYMARAAFLDEVAKQRRGADVASKTSKKQFADMAEAEQTEVNDLAMAIRLQPRLFTVYIEMIRVLGRTSGTQAERREALERGIKACPDCASVREVAMGFSTPRWGGSYAQMDALARQAVAESKNPRLARLAGAADWDRCNTLDQQKKPDEALAACQRALTHGDEYYGLIDMGMIYRRLHDTENALLMFDRALALRPQGYMVLARRAWLLAELGRLDEAVHDLELAAQLNPTDEVVVAAGAELLYVVDQTARKAAAAGKFAVAGDWWTRYLKIFPDDARGYYWRGSYAHQIDRTAGSADIVTSCHLGYAEACEVVNKYGLQ